MNKYRYIFTIAALLSFFTTTAQTEFITTWKTDNTGPSTDFQITIPTHPGSTYSYNVDWGDTNTDTGVTTDITHTYTATGTYTVTITGTFPRIYFNNSGDLLKILTIEQWGTNPWTSMGQAFYGCENLNITNGSIDNPDLSNVTDMSSMFEENHVFNGDITGWDVSNVTTMYGTFYACYVFDQDIGGWNVSNVTNMEYLLGEATSFNQDISGWHVSNVTSMYEMFYYAELFNQNIDGWNVSSVENMEEMFLHAVVFDQDLNSWDVSSVERMASMFDGAEAFNGNISEWNVSNVVKMRQMFMGATAFNQDIGNWNVSKVYGMNSMFTNAVSFDQDLGAWDISSVLTSGAGGSGANMSTMFEGATLSTANYDALLIGWSTDASGTAGDGIDDIPTGITFHGGSSTYCNGVNARQDLIDTYGWTITADGGSTCDSSNYFVTTWKTDNTGFSNNTSIAINTFPGDTYNYDVDWNYDGTTFTADDSGVTGFIGHNYGAIETYTVAIRGTFPRIYFSNNADKQKIVSVEQWGSSSWTSMNSAFKGVINLVVNASDAPDLYGVTDMSYMFEGATSLNSDISSWDVSGVTNMNAMFFNATSFNQDIGSWDITSLTDATSMFDGATLSTANYDALLIGWSTDASGTAGDGIDDIPSGITFHGGFSTYCNGANARQDLIDTYGWTISDGDYDCSTMSIVGFENDNIVLYPNPTNDKVIIKGHDQLTKIEIFNIVGQVVLKQNTHFDSVDMSLLESGVYLVKLYANESSKTVKIIKE